jgi:predicted unusual protein kinase regulating ubiquinone biosynthesis (AarF/ABC1/UbiB family)
MIIMEWIQGTKLTDVGALQEQDINPRAVGVATVRLFAELMFVHG